MQKVKMVVQKVGLKRHYLHKADPSSDISLNYLKNIVKSYALNVNAAFGLAGLTYFATKDEALAILLGALGTKVGVPNKPVGTKRTCYHNNCKLEFQYHNTPGTFKCPSCRQSLTFDV